MHHIPRPDRRALMFAILISALVLGAPATARAVGPVQPVSLPGGVNVFDTDPGNGERWGRAGGRDIEYTVLDPGQFSALSWGNVNGMTPGAAFDNLIDGAVSPGEIMSFDGVGSNLPAGVARWTGSAQITLTGPQTGVYTLPTRLTLTVTDHLGSPVPLGFVPGEVDPGLDVKIDTNGTFNANLLFEAFYPAGIPGGSMIGPGNDTWNPLLDLFDHLDTGVAQDGFAHTTVSTGFYFTLDTGGTGLTLEQHDQTVHTKLDAIFGDTDFLHNDVPVRFMGVQDALATIDQLVRNLPTTTTQIPPDLATQGAVDDAANRVQEALTQILLTVLGILPPDGTFPDDVDFSKLPLSGVAEQESVDDLAAAVAEIQAALSALPTGGEVRVEVVEISDQSTRDHRQWLVKTTQGGQLVDAPLIRLLAFHGPAAAVPTVDDLTSMAKVNPLATGLQEVLVWTEPGHEDAHAYLFEVHADGDPPAHGSALVDRTLPNQVGGGR